MPAAPASAEPMKKVRAMVVLMFTPISCAASRSCAVERMARPSRVRATKSCSPTSRTTVTTMISTLIQLTEAPKIVKRDCALSSCGNGTGDGPRQI